MSLLLLPFAAWAQPVEVAPVAPATTDVGLQAELLGGVDAWEGGGGAGSALRLAAGAQRRRGDRSLSAGYGGQLQVWAEPWSLDHHQAWATLRHVGGLGAEAALSGSIAQGWGEARLAPGLRLGGGETTAEVSLGGAVRTDGLAVPGAAAQAWASHRLHARWALSGWTYARLWAGDHLPATAAAGVGLTWHPRLDLDVRALVGGAGTLPGEQPARAGLLPAGAAMVRADLEVAWLLGPALAVVASGGWEGGRAAAGWSRYRAFAGLRTSIGRTRGAAPDPTPRAVRLTVEAPQAERVEVVGDFTEWRPLRLERSEEGWVLDVRLAPGVYEYAYLVDGASRVPPEAKQRRDDGFGGENGLLYVGAHGS